MEISCEGAERGHYTCLTVMIEPTSLAKDLSSPFWEMVCCQVIFQCNGIQKALLYKLVVQMTS